MMNSYIIVEAGIKVTAQIDVFFGSIPMDYWENTSFEHINITEK